MGGGKGVTLTVNSRLDEKLSRNLTEREMNDGRKKKQKNFNIQVVLFMTFTQEHTLRCFFFLWEQNKTLKTQQVYKN